MPMISGTHKRPREWCPYLLPAKLRGGRCPNCDCEKGQRPWPEKGGKAAERVRDRDKTRARPLGGGPNGRPVAFVRGFPWSSAIPKPPIWRPIGHAGPITVHCWPWSGSIDAPCMADMRHCWGLGRGNGSLGRDLVPGSGPCSHGQRGPMGQGQGQRAGGRAPTDDGATPTHPGPAPALAEGHQTRHQKFQKGI
jgi:hypothetical protein